MTIEELHAAAVANHERALANQRRADDLYDLIFPPWRWPKFWREWRAVRREHREIRARLEYLRGLR